jgi:anti-anti-sigma factor
VPEIEEGPTVAILRPKGDLDLATAPGLQQTLEKARATGKQIVVDMAEVSFIDSSGLRVLLSTSLSLDGNSPLRVTNAPQNVVRLLKLVGLEDAPSLDVQAAE